MGGLTNSTQEAQALVQRYGNDGLHIGAHSCGSMTVGNALQSLDKQGFYGIADKTEINFFAPAFNAQSMANTLEKLSDGKQNHVGLENHKYDFVGRLIGGNQATFDQVLPGSNRWKEAWKIMGSYPSIHACLGHAGKKCQRAYGPSHRVPIYSNHSRRKK
ncbi:hypothetical protein V3564_01960 [Bartonella sp. B12(2025)]